MWSTGLFLQTSARYQLTVQDYWYGASTLWCACLFPIFHRYLLHLPQRDGQAELSRMAGYIYLCSLSKLKTVTHPSTNQDKCSVTKLLEKTHYH